MNLWTVLENNVDLDDGRHCVAFWSWGSDEAIEHWRETYQDRYMLSETSCTAKIATTTFSPLKDGSHSETRGEVLREIEWRCEGDSTCDTCGLAEFDGLFPVCYDCNQCSECGCECDGDDDDPDELTQLRAENARLTVEIGSYESIIEHLIPTEHVVVCREGGGPESKSGTLCLSVARMASLLKDKDAEIEQLKMHPIELVEGLRMAQLMDQCDCQQESYIKCTECVGRDRRIEELIAKHSKESHQ